MSLQRIASVTVILCLLIAGFSGNLSKGTMKVYAEDDAGETAVSEMDALIKNYSGLCGIEVWSVEAGELYSHNPDTMISGASLIKLPYSYYVCMQLEEGVHSLDEKMTYTASWYHGGSGYIRKHAYGKSYTVQQLLDYMLRYSDNVAYDMLVYLFGVDGFNEMVEEWGYDIRIGKAGPRFPYVSADFIRTAMQKMYVRAQDGTQWEIAWTALRESTTNHIREVLGNEETPVAIKFGNETGLWHEACLIESETPYMLIVLTADKNGKNVKFLQNTARCAEKIVQAYHDAHPKIDPNGDGVTDEADISCLLTAIARLGARCPVGMSKKQRQAMDLNKDGKISAADVTELLSVIRAERESYD